MFLRQEGMVMIKPSIEEYIFMELLSDEQEVALDFISFLKNNNLIFYKDNCDCWKNKIYYWVKLDDECVCFIAIKDPDEKDNHWTVWSEDMGSEWFEQYPVDDKLLGNISTIVAIATLAAVGDTKLYSEKNLMMFVDVPLESIILLWTICFSLRKWLK